VDVFLSLAASPLTFINGLFVLDLGYGLSTIALHLKNWGLQEAFLLEAYLD
jgi:hypothetical protein